jgi:hypothetical protein
MAKTSDITVNDQGLNNEEYEEKEKIEKKPKKERTPEEQARLDELKQKKEGREKAISILRGISIRMPLLIYGASITDEDKQLTIDNFTSLVDDQSWEEFMPNGVTKEIFGEFKSYYDQDIFAAAGKRIRAMARAADNLTIEERIERITTIFATFRNPDKETVLTPWRVVNMHLGDCLGGYVFFEEDNETPLLEPRYIEHDKVTDDAFAPNAHLLEINSKSGLYPLYLAYNVYRRRLSEATKSPETLEEHQAIWDKVLDENIYVICKTPMAKSITRRTLHGFRKAKTNMWAPDDLINKIKNQPELFIKKVHDLIGNNVKINAIVGNPPYQEGDGGAGVSAKPMYHYFVDISKKLVPSYISLIMPARWFAGGKGLDDFRNQMLTDDQLRVIHDFIIPQECFPSVQIKGGICYFLWCNGNPGDCEVVTHYNGVITSREKRPLLEDGLETFIRFNEAIDVIAKVKAKGEPSMKPLVSSRKPFGFDTTFKGNANRSAVNDITVYQNKGVGYINKSIVTKNAQMIPEYKIFIPRASSGSDNFPHPILGEPFLGAPQSVCSETYMYIGPFGSASETKNAIKYIRTKFLRFLALQLKSTQDTPSFLYTLVPLQDFTSQSDIDWSKDVADIDCQLYAKYGITDEEIAFIESMIKPM